MAQRLIDANVLLSDSVRITGHFDLTGGRAQNFEAITVRAIEEAPTIDPIHAAGGCYCGECKHFSLFRDIGGRVVIKFCTRLWDKGSEFMAEETGFCSYGERGEAK